MDTKKIEKAIRYCKDTDTYFVQFSFSNRIPPFFRSFPTLEDARKYRDAVYAEKLRIKTEEDIAKIRSAERKEVCDEVYPYNILLDMNVHDYEIDCDTFENLIKTLTPREETCIVRFYRNRDTLEAIGKDLGVTRERIRQIVGKSLRKLKFKVYNHKLEEEKAQREKFYNDLYKQREELINVFKENGTITSQMEVLFGAPTFSMCYNNEEDNKPIESLDLSCRAYNCLKKYNINSIGELRKLSPEELLKIRNLGRKSTKEIQNKLIELGVANYEK